MSAATVQFIECARLVRPVPAELSARVMELIDDYRRGEINDDEYNKRFAELQQKVREQ